jgi:lipoprotein NlpI
MRSFRLAVFAAACVMATSAFAAAYDDFASGLSAYERGDYASAIPLFTAALNASDLAPNLKTTAYLDRARSYLGISHCQPALADLSAAKLADSNNIEITESLALAESCVADFKAAEADFTTVVQATHNPVFILARGHERWDAGDFTGAAVDFEATRAARPTYPYALLWLAMAQSRTGSDADALSHVSDLDLGTWPGPVMKLYLGQMKPEDVSVAAAQGDAVAVKNQMCEANFYIAEWWLAQKNTATAKALLQSAADNCPLNFVERGAARTELRRLQ